MSVIAFEMQYLMQYYNVVVIISENNQPKYLKKKNGSKGQPLNSDYHKKKIY